MLSIKTGYLFIVKELTHLSIEIYILHYCHELHVMTALSRLDDSCETTEVDKIGTQKNS